MKNKTNLITLFFVVFSILLALVSYIFLSDKFTSQSDFPKYSLIKDITFIIASAIIFKIVLTKNDIRNTKIFEKLKSTNDEIKESNEKYDIVAKATSDTIWDWKIQEDSFTWNKGIEGIFGYDKNEVGNTSKWWFDRIHPEDSIKMSIKLYSFIEQKTEKWQDEYRFMCADGNFKYVLDRGFLVKDESGSVIRMIGAIQDVTRAKQEEQRLKLLETVITQTKDAVIISESENTKNAIPKIVFVNQAFIEMTGYSPNEVLGNTPAIFMGKKSLKHDFKNISKALKDKEEYKFQTLNHRKNGEDYWINFSMISFT